MPDASQHDLPERHTALITRPPWMTRLVPARWMVLAVLLLVVSAFYVLVATAGKFRTPSWNTHYYDLAAEGFRQGHLYLPVEPLPKLLQQNDPLDYSHERLWLWDASLYHGRYYIYWGPAPALCVLAFKLLFGYPFSIDDSWLVLIFTLGRLFGGAALITSFAAHSGRRLPTWAVMLAILVFGMASPTLYFMARPVVYEASISGGQCFLVWGLVAAFWGLQKSALRLRLFALASVLWGLALSSRGSLLLVAPLLITITCWSAWRRERFQWRAGVAAALALGVPATLIVFAHGLYNYARFDSPLEFGLTHQLTGRPFMGDSGFVLPNVVSYFTAKLRWSCEFPYADLPVHRRLTKLIDWPSSYDSGNWDNGERVVGLLVATAFIWLVCLWPVRFLMRARLRRQRPPRAAARFPHIEQWLVLCAIACSMPMVPALRMYMATMRFMEDFAAGWLLAAVLAGFWLLRMALYAERRVLMWLASGLYVSLALYTLFVGALLGFRGQANNFRHENPKLFAELQEQLSVCRIQDALNE